MSGYSLPRPINESDDVATFDSGEPSLDNYLRTRALTNHAGGASRCFGTCQGGRVVGYYSLASGAVSHADLTGKFRRNMLNPVPVILLSRLAVDRNRQGRGLGENLLRDAIARSVQKSPNKSASAPSLCTRSTAKRASSTPATSSNRRQPTLFTCCC